MSDDTPWFDPFTFSITLPQRVTDIRAQTSDVLPLIHENLHYIQSVGSFVGIYRFLCFWRAHSQLSQHISAEPNKKYNDKLRTLAKEIFNEANDSRKNLEPLFIHLDYKDPLPLGTTVLEFSNGDRERVFVKQLDNGTYRAFSYTNEALCESMAVAYEIWLGHSTKHLEAFRSSEDPQIFQYAIGIETVRAITNITDDRKLAQITFVLLDFALSHVSPSDILFKSLNFINPDNEKLFDSCDISALYRELTEQLIVPEMDEETKKLSDYVDMITNTVTKENDEFDLAIKSFTELMSSSLQLRKTVPAYICNTLLFNFHEPEFLENYHLPLYRNKNAIVDTGINSKRFDAVLFLEILFHRMRTLVDESTAKICPMYNNDICKFKRVAACKEAPWDRRFQDELKAGTQVCLYRFVEHGLENISDNNTI